MTEPGDEKLRAELHEIITNPQRWLDWPTATVDQLLALFKAAEIEARKDEVERVLKQTVRCYYHDDRGRVIETPSGYLTGRRNELEQANNTEVGDGKR